MGQYDDLVKDYAEIGVDHILEEASKYLPALQIVGEETPIVRTAIAAVTVPKTISDAILASKVNAFLYAADLSEEKVLKFKKKFSGTKQEKLWKSVFHSVNSHDNEKKSEIIGKLFGALISGFIDESEFATLTHAANTMNVASLNELRAIYHLVPEVMLPTTLLINFSFVGLINTDNSTVGRLGGGEPKYPPNNLGWKFIGIVYDFPASGIPGIKIGEGALYKEVDRDGMATGSSWPLSYMQNEGYIYQDIQGYVIDRDGSTLVNAKTGLPYMLTAHPVMVEQMPFEVAGNHFKGYSKGPGELFQRLDAFKQVNAFVVESDKELPGTKFELTSRVKDTISELEDDDKRVFFVEVIHRLQSFQLPSGEKHDEWISAYDNCAGSD